VRDVKRSKLPINKIVHGDVLEVLKKLPSKSIDCVITSPPYWAKRDYGEETNTIWGGNPNCEHEWTEEIVIRTRGALHGANAQVGNTLLGISGTESRCGRFCKKCGAWFGQLGMEPDPFMFVDHLIEIFKEVKRVLKPHGNVFVIIDDTYNGSQGWKGGGGLTYKDGEWERKWVKEITIPEPPTAKFRGVPKKSLLLVPEMFAIKMVYELGFILRQKIVWTKKVLIYKNMETHGNGMPESARDRQPHNWEYVYHFVKKPKYWYDQDAVRVPYTKPLDRWGGEILIAKGESKWDAGTGQNTYRTRSMQPNPLGANAPDTLLIETEPFPEAHFAVFPERLVEFLIKVGCPEQICKKCGSPRRRILRTITEMGKEYKDKTADYVKASETSALRYKKKVNIVTGVDWTDCGCGAGWESGVVLDPFLGSGTTALVALKLNRRFIGIEINREYCEMALKRIKPYLNQLRLYDVM